MKRRATCSFSELIALLIAVAVPCSLEVINGWIGAFHPTRNPRASSFDGSHSNTRELGWGTVKALSA